MRMEKGAGESTSAVSVEEIWEASEHPIGKINIFMYL